MTHDEALAIVREYVKNEGNELCIEVAVFTLNNEHAGKIQEMVEKNIQNL